MVRRSARAWAWPRSHPHRRGARPAQHDVKPVPERDALDAVLEVEARDQQPLACHTSTSERRTGRPASSSTRPTSTIFSPSGALLPHVVRSASLSLTKLLGNVGPAASSGLGATRTGGCAGARSRVLLYSGYRYGGWTSASVPDIVVGSFPHPGGGPPTVNVVGTIPFSFT